MNDLIHIDEERGIPVLDSRLAAKELGVEHRSLKDVIRDRGDVLGIVRLQTALSQGPGMPETFYLLNERQATLLITMVRNTEEALVAKAKLVDAFFEMRDELRSIERKSILEFAVKIKELATKTYRIEERQIEEINEGYEDSDTVGKIIKRLDGLETIVQRLSRHLDMLDPKGAKTVLDAQIRSLKNTRGETT